MYVLSLSARREGALDEAAISTTILADHPSLGGTKIKSRRGSERSVTPIAYIRGRERSPRGPVFFLPPTPTASGKRGAERLIGEGDRRASALEVAEKDCAPPSCRAVGEKRWRRMSPPRGSAFRFRSRGSGFLGSRGGCEGDIWRVGFDQCSNSFRFQKAAAMTMARRGNADRASSRAIP